MKLRMTSIVFRDKEGIVHYCEWEQPKTVCGESRLRLKTSGTARTIQEREGLPTVTCMLCISQAEDPHWA